MWVSDDPDARRPYQVNDLRGTSFMDEELSLATYSSDLKVYETRVTTEAGTYSIWFAGRTCEEAVANLSAQLLARGIGRFATEKPLDVGRYTRRKFGEET